MISLPVLLGVLLIGFLLLQVVPTDPATVVAGPTATKAEVDAIRNDLGLNQPLWVQFGRYLGRVFQLDLGRSMISNRAVVDEIALTLWPTIELMLACLIWAVPLGITLGTLAARRRGTLIDRAIMALSVMGVSVPVFWVGLLLIQYVGGAGILPFQGRNGPIWTPDGFLSIILPAVTLGAVFVGPVARMTRTSLLETLGADYVRTARAKGASDWRVTVRHALRNAHDPRGDAGRPADRLSAGRLHRHRDHVRLAGRRPHGSGRHHLERLPAGAGRHPDPRRRLHGHQPRGRRALRLSRSKDCPRMTDAALPLQSEADQRAIAAIRRKNAVWRRILRDPPAAAAALFLIVIVGSAILAPWIAPFDPYASNMRLRLCPIGGARCPDFLLGADNQGRDMVSRILFGLRATLGIGIAAVLVGGGLGALIGLSAAYFKRLDQPLMRLIDVLLSFPSILFGLAIAAVMGTGLFSLVVALSIASIPSIARIARGAAQSIMQQEYMEAGRAVGLGDGALIWRYLALNCWPTILIYMTLQLGQAILLGAALSFLGLGAQPPTAELGSMAADGRKFLSIAPHVSTLPCAAIFLVVLAFNVLGDALRDALDPKLRQ